MNCATYLRSTALMNVMHISRLGRSNQIQVDVRATYTVAVSKRKIFLKLKKNAKPPAIQQFVSEIQILFPSPLQNSIRVSYIFQKSGAMRKLCIMNMTTVLLFRLI